MSDSDAATSHKQTKKVPHRPYGHANPRLPPSLPIIGLGCSSYSTFFWSPEELPQETTAQCQWTPDGMDRSHPRVQEWIQTIRRAVEVQGILLLDTAPWYGHGTSEVVIGWAMEEMLQAATVVDRKTLVINTKVGRYEADPAQQFDFSYKTTVASVERSIQRMKCSYIDVLQLHDPEFATALEVLLQETIPALLECRQKGYCKALGITGFPLITQYQIIQRSLELDPTTKNGMIWDQSLSYGHYNIANTSLCTKPININENEKYDSFAHFCHSKGIGIMAAAPLNMGLLTKNAATLPDWHPAHDELKHACQKAAAICDTNGVDIVTLALVFAISNPDIPCTVIGMKNLEEVNVSAAIASRFHGLEHKSSQEELLKCVLSESEWKTLNLLRDSKEGPFAAVWENGNYTWDGIAEAIHFWKQVDGVEQNDWHLK